MGVSLAKRTTFILGAGASLHAGYPFASTIGKGLLDWMKSAQSNFFDFAGSATFLEAEYGSDIEAMMNGMQRAIRRRASGHSVLANCYKPASIEALRQWFDEIHRRHQARAYEAFANAIVQPGDCIISFNYDISLDSELRRARKWEIGDGYGFSVDGLPKGSPVMLLKIHGSINWLAVMFGGIRDGQIFIGTDGVFGNRPVFSDGDLAALGYANLADPRFPRNGTAAVPPLILPTSRKQFFFQTNLGREWAPFWNSLWKQARGAVRESQRIVIFGYGMYPIDRRGCNLLLEGKCNAEIEVCCGGDSDRIVAQLSSRGRSAYRAQQMLFEDWASSFTGGWG